MDKIPFLAWFWWVICALPLDALAEVYKWTDDQGQVHYTQSPPAGGGTADVIKPPPKVDTEGALKKLEDQKKQAETQRESQLKAAEEKKKTEQAAAGREKQCEEARSRLAGLTNAPRIYKFDPQGNRQWMDDAERQSAIAETQKNITEFCQ
jgi:hypothetical protein